MSDFWVWGCGQILVRYCLLTRTAPFHSAAQYLLPLKRSSAQKVFFFCFCFCTIDHWKYWNSLCRISGPSFACSNYPVRSVQSGCFGPQPQFGSVWRDTQESQRGKDTLQALQLEMLKHSCVGYCMCKHKPASLCVCLCVLMWRNGGAFGGKLLNNATWGIVPQEIHHLAFVSWSTQRSHTIVALLIE